MLKGWMVEPVYMKVNVWRKEEKNGGLRQLSLGLDQASDLTSEKSMGRGFVREGGHGSCGREQAWPSGKFELA